VIEEAALLPVQRGDRLHIFWADLDIEDVEILLDAQP
jgi:hypothetical protein